MNKVSIAELAKAVADKHGLPLKNAEAFVAECFNVINNGLHADKAVKVRGFGTFKVVDVRERESVNVNTGERVTIEGHGKISFTPDPIMRDLVNKPFAKFDTVVLNEGVDIDELNNIGGEETEDELEEETVYESDHAEKTETEPSVEPEITDVIAPKKSAVEDESPAFEEEKPVIEQQTTPVIVHETATAEPVAAIIEPETAIIESKTIPVSELETATAEPETKAEETGNLVSDDATEAEQEEQTDDFEDEEPSFAMRHKTLLTVAGAFLIAALAFAGGYLLGQNMSSRPIFKTVKVYNVAKPKAESTVKAALDTVKTAADTLRNKPAKVEKEAASQPETTTAAGQKKPTEPEKVAEPTSAATALAQRQVRTGAYNIVGTERTITVRKGQTLSKISKTHLGEGMECYIQVHNGIDDVDEGMKLKIPKLRLKKR